MTETPAKTKKCRGCSVVLTEDNARVYQGRFIGACRACESGEARKRYERANPGAKHYTDERRKYDLV